MTGGPALAQDLVARLYRQSGAARWSLSVERFAEALAASAAHRFGGDESEPGRVAAFVSSLHLEDLALATACAAGVAEAWDHFVLTFRPVLYRAAHSLRPPGDARDLADSLYADLFGLEVRDGRRRSLFEYYHGRASLTAWLRTVLAQRAVDRARAQRRLSSLDTSSSGEAPGHRAAAEVLVDPRPAEQADPHRPRYVAAVRTALTAALAALAARDRLRLALYYARGLRLSQVGRLTGESEATVSRKLDRTRRELRAEVARRLRAESGLTPAQAEAALACAVEDDAFDLREALPVPDS